ncbi:MAG: hypothetical protein RIC35_02850 [Marinoscillum sp.]
MSTTGLSAGLAFRVLEHAQVRVEDYTYEANYNWQIYVDAMYAPVSNIEDFNNESIPYGGRVGLLSTGKNWDWYGELCLYPKSTGYLIFGFLFDLGWEFK